MASHHGKKKKKRPSSGANRDPSIDEFHEFDPDMEFLPLDDVLPTDKSEGRRKINLREERERPGSDVNATGVDLNNSMANGGNNRTPDVTLLSLGGVMSATRVDQDGTFMINRQSLDRASPSAMSRMLMNNLQGGRGGGVGGLGGDNNGGEGNLRLLAGMCDVAQNGALLMPGTRASVFVNGEAAPSSQDEDIQIFPGGMSPGHGAGDGENDFGAGDNASFGGGGGDDWGGDDNDGVGFELNDAPMEGTGGNNDEERKEDEDDVQTVAMNNRNVSDEPPPKPKPVEDPWALLDPHEPSSEKPRPLKIGVTYRLPPELEEDDRPSAAVTGSRTRAKKKTAKKKSEVAPKAYDFRSRPFLADVTFDEAMRDDDDEDMDRSDASMKPRRTNRHLELLRSKGLVFGDEFAYIAKAHAKHRDAIRKQRRMQKQQEAQNEAETNNNIFDADDHDDYGGGFDFGGDDDSFGGHDGYDDPNNDQNEEVHRSNVDFNAIDDVFGSAGGGDFDDNDFDGDGDFGNDSQRTFEELCRAHLRKFAKKAEVYAAETQLTKRVGAWQAGLAPVLDEQERRPEFDIHGCGRMILERVERSLSIRKRTSTGEKKLETNKEGNVVGFSTIFAKDCEDYEVCRLFLSTLMLCNCGNVALKHGGGDGQDVESTESLKIELLSNLFQPPMETFVAPSAEDLYQEEVASSN